MPRNRNTETWHIPKRGSIHQIVGFLNIINYYKIDGKKWPNNRKLFDQKFAMWGFTSRGRSLSKNASETLEALLKYLGLICIDDTKKIRITQAGMALIEEYPISEPDTLKRKLNETIFEMGNINSEVITHQMMKLVLTNPPILQYCQNINVFPFRETMLLLLDDEINYLSPEEFAMFVFFMRDKSERLMIKNHIIAFRKLQISERDKLISDFKNTPEGNLMLVKAPTSTYWRQLCTNTGLFEVNGKNICINDTFKSKAIQLLNGYDDEIYDFQNNKKLWNEYFTYPDRKMPFDLTICIIIVGNNNYLLKISNDFTVVHAEVIQENSIVKLPVFNDENYQIHAIKLDDGRTVYAEEEKFNYNSKSIKIQIDDEIHDEKDQLMDYNNLINELIESKTLDNDYKIQLQIISDNIGINLLDSKNIPSIRGGRLEFLFFKLLQILQEKEKITELKWNGKLDKYGIARPAPGTQRGLSDIIFKCNDIYFLLELTTIKSSSGQWKAEGSSVPFHIRNFDPNGIKKVVGIYSPPIVHEKIDTSIKTSLIPNRYNIISIEIPQILDVLINSSDICEDIIKKLKQQYKELGIPLSHKL